MIIATIWWSHIVHTQDKPDSKVHGANMGPTWGRQDPCGPREPCYLGSHTWPLKARYRWSVCEYVGEISLCHSKMFEYTSIYSIVTIKSIYSPVTTEPRIFCWGRKSPDLSIGLLLFDWSWLGDSYVCWSFTTGGLLEQPTDSLYHAILWKHHVYVLLKNNTTLVYKFYII